MGEPSSAARWERHAAWWQAGFTCGADPEYEHQILPLAARWLRGCERVLDIGCGEGQVARVAAGQGSSVVGLDLARAQLSTARRRGGGPSYLRGCADRLPVRAGSFDAALACLVLEHVDAIDRTFAEMSRALRPGGRFVLFLNHPLLQTPGSGWIDDHVLDPPEQYWRVGPYLTERSTTEEVEPGVFIEFFHRPLSRYVNGLAAHGLSLRHMDEPPPPPAFLARAPEYPDAATIPRLLLLVAEKE